MLEKFIKLEKKPLYQVITGLYWQSGLSVGDATRILYGGIKDEFEAEVCPICLASPVKADKKQAWSSEASSAQKPSSYSNVLES